MQGLLATFNQASFSKMAFLSLEKSEKDNTHVDLYASDSHSERQVAKVVLLASERDLETDWLSGLNAKPHMSGNGPWKSGLLEALDAQLSTS